MTDIKLLYTMIFMGIFAFQWGANMSMQPFQSSLLVQYSINYETLGT